MTDKVLLSLATAFLFCDVTGHLILGRRYIFLRLRLFLYSLFCRALLSVSADLTILSLLDLSIDLLFLFSLATRT
jgi:hypothetical protein